LIFIKAGSRSELAGFRSKPVKFDFDQIGARENRVDGAGAAPTRINQ